MPLTVPVAPWSRCLLPVALWLRMRSVTRENSAASTVPSPFRSNILKAIWKCLREVDRTVSRKM